MVLKRLFAAARKPEPATHRIPSGQRVYAVGDIHGRLDLLDDLLSRIDRDDAERAPATTTLIFLGDLVDRGPQSSGVVDRLMRLRALGRNVHFLMGNHEEVFLLAAAGDVQAMRLFVRIGGMETILSYGVSEEEYRTTDFEELTALFAKRVSPEHVAFISSFEDYLEIGDYLFVHAGLRPGVALDEQKPSDLRWIRDDFLLHGDDFGHVVVHGHSITEAVDVRPNRIGIDTGAYESGRLTAIGLEGAERWFLST
jgi:serine/threonine protein phosphatase 1